MPLWNRRMFPGTNLQDLNLDWILRKISALRGGTAGQYLYKKSNKDFDFGWKTGGGGGGGTSDYLDLDNKPSINNVELAGNKTAADLGLATPSDIPAVPVQSVNGKTGAVVLSASDVGAYVKPESGIPKTDLSSAVQTSLDKADTAYTKPESGIPKTDLSSTVQTSLDKADTALQAVPAAYRTSAAQDAIDAAQNAQIESLAGSLATIESSPATAAHAVGDYIVYNGRLYEVTAAITSGQSLVVGTNIKSTTATDLIADAKQQLLPAGTWGLQAYGYITSSGRRLSVSCPAASFHSETVQIIDAIDSLIINLRTFFFADNTLAGGYVKSANFDATPYILNATVGSGGRGLYFALLMPEGETWGTLNNIPVAGDMSIILNRDV